jgi:predicted O-methyltransferase YrrM
MMGFEDIAFLFTCDNRNRGVIRMNFDEAACLWRAVARSSGTILEIGRRHGGSTVLLLAASDSSRDVISVDMAPAHNILSESFFAQPAMAVRLKLEVADSRTYKAPPLGLVFIDGDHTFEGVASDVIAHWPQVSLHGLAVFHDAVPNDGLAYNNEINHCPGVRAVCDALFLAGVARVADSAGSVLVLQKLGELPAGLFGAQLPVVVETNV